ncbi:hypothetical protein BFP70_08645 [Thioclava sp. SK-1]|nr:hypothetical protein BFP70_08645 [Thioclava sp. SK-1]
MQLWFSAAEIIIQDHVSGWHSAGPTGHDLKDKLGISYVAAHRLKRKIIAELLLPHGGIIGECILMPDDSGDWLDDQDLDELDQFLNSMR